MQTLDDVARLALALPQVTEGVDKFRKTSRTWEVAGKAFAWERPFSKADIKRFGDATPPAGAIVAIRTADLHEKEAILAANPGAFFTIPHFDGYKAYLVQLDNVTAEALREALVDGWLAVAPPSLTATFERSLSVTSHVTHRSSVNHAASQHVTRETTGWRLAAGGWRRPSLYAGASLYAQASF